MVNGAISGATKGLVVGAIFGFLTWILRRKKRKPAEIVAASDVEVQRKGNRPHTGSPSRRCLTCNSEQYPNWWFCTVCGGELLGENAEERNIPVPPDGVLSPPAFVGFGRTIRACRQHCRIRGPGSLHRPPKFHLRFSRPLREYSWQVNYLLMLRDRVLVRFLAGPN
jgi:hypothetical protein